MPWSMNYRTTNTMRMTVSKIKLFDSESGRYTEFANGLEGKLENAIIAALKSEIDVSAYSIRDIELMLFHVANMVGVTLVLEHRK